MKRALLHGLGFGLTSGVITTLGMMVGMYSGTHLKGVVLTSIVLIAVADGLSDAFAIHISEETDKNNSKTNVRLSAFSTLFAKLLMGLLFSVIVWLLPLQTAIIVNVIIGFTILGFFSALMARRNNRIIYRSVSEDLLIGLIVIVIGYYLGQFLQTI